MLQDTARACRRGIEIKLAGVGAGPKLPFDTGVIDAKAGIDEEAGGDNRKQKPGPSPLPRSHQHQGTEQHRNACVVSITLLKAERAGPVATDILKPQRSQNDGNSRDEDRGPPSIG